MNNLFKLIFKYNFTIIFIFIELFCLFLVVKYNVRQKETFLSSANFISGRINLWVSYITDYLYLKKANLDLSIENARLKNLLKSSYKSNTVTFLEIHDSVYSQQYVYISAQVIKNSVNKLHNYILIDKGAKHGIKTEMAVVSPAGVVGIVKDVSANFASVISLLNTRLLISGKLKSSGYFGAVNWEGNNYREAKLKDIPYHVKPEKGDTVVTSGYSTIFPEGIPIGTVTGFSIGSGENFYDITIQLTTDFKKLSYVHVIGNLMKKEQEALENTENTEKND